MNRNLPNQRAAFAFKRVSELHGELLQKYRSLVRSFPAMILSNGYGLAIAFLYSKKKGKESQIQSEHGQLYKHINDWLTEQKFLSEDKKDLMKNIAESDKDTYRLLESETLALLEWLKRFAEGAEAI